MRAGISGLGGGVVEGVRGGLSGLSQATQTAAEVVVQKPREFFRHHFGSEDNLVQLKAGAHPMLCV